VAVEAGIVKHPRFGMAVFRNSSPSIGALSPRRDLEA